MNISSSIPGLHLFGMGRAVKVSLYESHSKPCARWSKEIPSECRSSASQAVIVPATETERSNDILLCSGEYQSRKFEDLAENSEKNKI